MLRFPSLQSIFQFAVARPTTVIVEETREGVLLYSGLVLHTVEQASVEFAEMTELLNHAKAKTFFIGRSSFGDEIRGLTFRYFNNGYVRVPKLESIAIANTSPVEACSEDGEVSAISQSESAFGVYASNIECDDECLQFPSLATIAVQARSFFNVAVFLQVSSYPLLRLNALEEIDMPNGSLSSQAKPSQTNLSLLLQAQLAADVMTRNPCALIAFLLVASRPHTQACALPLLLATLRLRVRCYRHNHPFDPS